ncbi:hypothetical protein [Solimonas sp. SE-A11]|uniref:hypothetical protein n=1 Tax=Solimonas sp. SE-A11 TaxID=3054954 RepID=UPI00259D1105|nr:hypothetical protein [Solimonas sp. SE-A11]MDM4772193.1 hypothetical protein [Solimonas sp. SE-A11]
MSIDPWGGGTDEDPKLRLKELRRQELRLKRFRGVHPARVPWQKILFAIFAVIVVARFVLHGWR